MARCASSERSTEERPACPRSQGLEGLVVPRVRSRPRAPARPRAPSRPTSPLRGIRRRPRRTQRETQNCAPTPKALTLSSASLSRSPNPSLRGGEKKTHEAASMEAEIGLREASPAAQTAGLRELRGPHGSVASPPRMGSSGLLPSFLSGHCPGPRLGFHQAGQPEAGRPRLKSRARY